jgi:hypothetical protein
MLGPIGIIGKGFGPVGAGDYPEPENVLPIDTTNGVTGTYVPDFPAVGNVLTIDTVNGVPGTLVLPAAAVVVDTGVSDWELAAARAQVAAFGVAVTYKPFGGTARPILAIVDRNPAGKVGGGKETVGPKMTICVVNWATDGISSAEFVGNKDKMSLVLTLGKAAEERLLTRILRQDSGMLMIEVG